MRALTLIFLLAVLAVPADAGERIEIAAGGKSPYVIVVPDQADRERVLRAAGLLQETIQKAVGARLPIVKESERPQGAPAFCLGKSQAARNALLPVDEVKGWAYLNKAAGRDIFLVGDDGVYDVRETRRTSMPNEHLGTLKAVTAFLEEQAGVRFVLPGERGVCVPRLARLEVDAQMQSSWKPLFDSVLGAPVTLRNDNYAVANNLFYSNAVLRDYGAHSYPFAVPAAVYGEKHPEYFALIGGVRTTQGNHLCISNPEVQELMLREMEKGLDLGYQWTELGQTDGYQACQCPSCVAINADPGERTWIVHRKLAEALQKRRPGRKVEILSYPPTQRPPKSFDRFPDNVLIEMCDYSPEAFAAWAPFNVGKVVYTYNWGAYHPEGISPKRTPRVVVDQIRLFVKNGVRGIKIDGGFNRSSCQGWGLEAPVYYAYGKALGDPNRDPDALLREYVEAAYGSAAAAPMRAFFTALYAQLELYSRVPAGVSGFSTPESFFCHFFPPKLLADMTVSLERAKAVAEDDDTRARLELVELEFNYIKKQAEVFQFYRTYRLDPSWETLNLLAAKVQARRDYVDWLYPNGPDGRQRAVAGLPAPYADVKKSVLEAGGRVMGAPLNWDFALLREKKVLPGVGMKRVECPRVDKVLLDGKLDDPAWQAARFEELGEIGMGALKNAARFKTVYDDRYIYFGVVCELDDLKRVDAVKPVGRRGPASGQECVEIMLDAFGTRERYCHFLLNPVPDSRLERRFGYVDDPLHPLFNQFDNSWSGAWDYAATVDRQGLRWTAEVRIPFSTLEAQPPGHGVVWTVNIGRTEWPLGPGGAKVSPVYSLWSPNLESRSFHDLASFGDLLFK